MQHGTYRTNYMTPYMNEVLAPFVACGASNNLLTGWRSAVRLENLF